MFFDISREIHILSIQAFSSAPPNTCGARSAQIRLASARPVRSLILNSTDFFKIPQILRACFRCMKSFTSTGQTFLSGIFILTYVNDTSSPHARQHLCSSLHLTNPGAEPKDSQPNLTQRQDI